MQNKVQLIAYADRFGGSTISSLTATLRQHFSGVYEGVHILPFFTPFDGADAGFDPVELSRTHEIMVDTIVNHVSWESEQFQDVMKNGENSPFAPMFLTLSSVFPEGVTEDELAGIYRPRPGLPLTHYSWGEKTRLVWTTFTPQQVDIDTDSKQGWDYLMSILDQLGASHVSSIRLDAVGYGAKEARTSCFMIPKTFRLIERIKEEGAKRGLETLIEVHSYYKKQIDIASKVDRVYDFALPPLLLHSIFSGSVDALEHWINVRPNNAVTVLDTHDGIGVIDIGSDQPRTPLPWDATTNTTSPREQFSSSYQGSPRSTTWVLSRAQMTWSCSSAPMLVVTLTVTTTPHKRSKKPFSVRLFRPSMHCVHSAILFRPLTATSLTNEMAKRSRLLGKAKWPVHS